MGSVFQTFQRHGASRRVPHQAFQLIPSRRWHLGGGVQRKPVDTGTAGARACGAFPCIPKTRAHKSHLLSGPLAQGHPLRDGGGQGVGEGGLVDHERVIPRGPGGVAARLQVSQVAQLTDDAPADRLRGLRPASARSR